MRCPRRRALRCRAVRQLRIKVQAVVLLSCLSMTAAHDCQLFTRVHAVVLLYCQSMTAAQDLTSAATVFADTIMSPHVTLRGSVAIPAGRFSLNGWIATTMAIGLLALVCTMMPAQGGGAGRVHRAPPSWSPEQAQAYPFRTWTQDLQIWSIAHVDIPPAQQAANIIMQLGGAARELVRNMSYDQIAHGGMIGGVQQDPVTFLVAQLATNYAPLGEETRLTAMTELMQFRKNQGETIDNLITRFLSTKHRAEVGGVNMVLSIEGYSWILLRACGVTQQQLLSLLQSTNSRFPNTDDEFNALMMSLRRMGHILEGSIGNIASQLRAPPSSSFPTFEASDPWQQGQDPWQNSTASSDAWQNWSGGTAQYGNQQAYTSLAQLPPVPDDDDDDDTATISSDGEADYTGLGGLTPNQVDEHLFWAYDSGRRNWRAHMQRPTRFVRRTIKGKGKSKGRKGKGKGRYSFLESLSDEAYSVAFYGKGKGKGKRRSFNKGKGKGRQSNPRGRDGQVMTCSICGSESHFRAECPQNTEQTHFQFITSDYVAGPLSDLIRPTDEPRVLQTQIAMPTWTTSAAAEAQEAGVHESETQAHEHRQTGYGSSGWDRVSHPGAWNANPPMSEYPLEEDQEGWPAPQAPQAPDDFHFVSPPARQPSYRRSQQMASLETLLHQREQLIDGILRANEPTSVPRLAEPENAIERIIPEIMHFQHHPARRQTALNYAVNDGAIPWIDMRHMTGTYDAPSVVNNEEELRSMPSGFELFALQMSEIQRESSRRMVEVTLNRRQQAAQLLARYMHEHPDSAAPTASAQTELPTCVICQEAYISQDTLSILSCQHSYHQDCINAWCAARHEQDAVPLCPTCRGVVDIMATVIYNPDATTNDENYPMQTGPAEIHHVGTPSFQSAETGGESIPSLVSGSEMSMSWNDPRRNLSGMQPRGSESESSGFTSSVFPWWPVTGTEHISPVYHASTQLPNGRVSIIIDPGAWTNLIGSTLARKLTQVAMKFGIKPKQTKMSEPLTIQGVGNGTQACRYKMDIPIAVPHADGTSHQHTLSSPIVEGTGSELPGLLGLRSLEAARAILDTGNKRLIFPGPGPLEIKLPPGSVEIPLHKAPSGHLVMIIDDYEKLAAATGGIAESGLQLHTTGALSEPDRQEKWEPPPGLELPAQGGREVPEASGNAPVMIEHAI